MSAFIAIYRREMGAYLLSPLAYIFISVFVSVSILFAIEIGQAIEVNSADLQSFFQFLPWLFMIFMPALGMRIWAEEFKSGTYEILFSLPVSTYILVLSKFCASLSIAILALILCLPLWFAISLLGPVDGGVAFLGFMGAILMAASFLAISQAISAFNKNQIIAFIFSSLICFLFIGAGLPVVSQFIMNLFGINIQNLISYFSILDNFDIISRGQLTLNNLIFFTSLIGFWLVICVFIIDGKRSAKI